jgi:hypothetical protein
VADVEFAGERFATADKIGLMPLMRFAKVAKAGTDSGDMEGLAALYDLLQQCVAPEDWARFEAAADRSRADGEELMKVMSDVMEVMAKRPTSRPSDSSAGPTITPPSSEGDSSSRVARRLEQEGRPDLALVVELAAESRSAISA